MKKLRRFLFTFALCMSMLSAIPLSGMTVYAAEESGKPQGNTSSATTTATDPEVFDTGDAIQDIMQNPRFKGAISSISKITEFVDVWFIRIISLVSFFIISAALLKNACAGAYCANSKFWDKVADAHQKTDALNMAGVKNYFSGGQGLMNTTPGGIRDFFLGLIPNIKAFTDFEDADIEPKAYFMKAIPQMIACVVIGIFIYNGYYRDTAATVGEMGSVLIERTLGSVNPDSFVNKIFNTTGWPKSPWDKDKSREGQWKQAIFKELKTICASNYSDITSASQKAEAVTAMAQMVNNAVNSSEVNGKWEEFEEEDGKYTYEMSGISSYASSDIGASNECIPDSVDNYACTFVFDMTGVGASTSRTEANKMAYVSFTLKKTAGKSGQGASGANVDGWGATGPATATLELDNDTAVVSKPSDCTIDTDTKKVTLKSDIVIPVSNYTSTPCNDCSGGVGKMKRSGDNAGKEITLPAGTYDLTADGKIALGRLSYSSNKGTGMSNTIYVGFR